MGTIRKGILGGFSGKVGTVVGANRRGTAYMRSLPIKMKNLSPFNAAMSYTIANAITGTYPNYAVDPSKVLISCGTLSSAFDATATPALGGGAIYFDWDNNSGSSAANATDKTLVAVVNPAKSQAIFDTAGATRTDASQSVNIPANWVGDTVHTYLGFISKDGKETANSLYFMLRSTQYPHRQRPCHRRHHHDH